MKKIVFALGLMFCFLIGFVAVSDAVDWSRFASGRNNIRLDGYQDQPSYISFSDGNGLVEGYLFPSDNGKLYWQGAVAGDTTVDGIDLTTTQLGSVGGEIPLW